MIVIVLGMHRSGTSALAGLLHHNGVDMGEGHFRPKPSKQNPKGFFEDYRFRKLNDKILGEHGYKVESFDPNMPPSFVGISEKCRSQMRKLIDKQCSEHAMWGWKDPRTCLTGLNWLACLIELSLDHKVKVIAAYRNVANIRQSMLARGNKETEPDGFITLAGAYEDHAALLRPDLWVDFEDLVNYPEAIARQLTEIGIPITDTSFIDPTLANRSSKND